MDEQFYVTLFSTASQSLYKNNKHSAYTIQLAQPIDLRNGKWEVGICEFTYPSLYAKQTKPISVLNPQHALIYTDLIVPQFVGSQLVRCLRTFMFPAANGVHIFDNLYYVPVEKQTFQSISIEILQPDGVRVAFPTSTTDSKAVLHFRRIATRV